MAYNYRQAVLADTEQMIRETKDYILDHFDAESLEDIDRDELENYITEKAQYDDGVTGNASGAYGFAETGVSAYRSEEALIDNDRLIARALVDNDCQLGSNFSINAETLDVMIRYDEVPNVVSEAIDNVIESPDKQVAESESIEISSDYSRFDFSDEVCRYLEEVIEDEIEDILEEAGINSEEDYEYGRGDIESRLCERIERGEIELPYVNDLEVMHNMDNVLGNPELDSRGYTVAEYFSDRSVESEVKEMYAISVALGEIENAIDHAYENVIEPAIEAREAEAEKEDVDLDE